MNVNDKQKIIGRPLKKNTYENERKNIILKLNAILNITKEQKYFKLDNIDLEKQKKILALESKVQKYFLYAKWPYFKGTRSNAPFLSLLKSIYKSEGYKVQTMSALKRKDDKTIREVTIFIEKDE